MHHLNFWSFPPLLYFLWAALWVLHVSSSASSHPRCMNLITRPLQNPTTMMITTNHLQSLDDEWPNRIHVFATIERRNTQRMKSLHAVAGCSVSPRYDSWRLWTITGLLVSTFSNLIQDWSKPKDTDQDGIPMHTDAKGEADLPPRPQRCDSRCLGQNKDIQRI